MAQVFISYAESDKLIADAVCARLEEREIRCWIAPRDVELGQWAESLHRAIDDAQIMVVILSCEANASPIVFREVERAVTDGDFIVPFRIEDVELSRGMELLISSNHWLDAMSPPMERRISELATKVGALLRSHPPGQPDRSRRRKLVATVRHPPHEDLLEPPPRAPVTRKMRRLIPAAATAVLAAAALVIAVALDLIGSDRSAPQPGEPADGALVIGQTLGHKWSFDAEGRSSLEYEIRRDSNGITEPIGRSGANSYDQKPQMVGPMTWQVRATWMDGDERRESDWSEPRTVTWYPNTLKKIQETGVVNLAYSEDAVQFERGEKEATGFEIEFLRRALGRYLQDHGGGDLEIRRVSFFAWGQEFFNSLKSPNHDVMIGGITILDSREFEWGVEFTEPLISYPQTFVYLRDRVTPQKCLARGVNVTPCRIGVKEGTTNEQLAVKLASSDHEGTEVRRYKEDEVYDVISREIAEGGLDLAIMDRPYALYLRAKNNSLKLEDIEGSEQCIGIATKVGDSELRGVLNAAIPTYRSEILKMLSNLESRTDIGESTTVAMECA